MSSSLFLCANCNTPANAECSSCKLAPLLNDEAPCVRYCNSRCQRAHWPNHIPICRQLQDRTKLFRVIEFAQRLFYIFQELTWISFNIRGMQKLGSDLILRGNIRENTRWPRDFQCFPHSLFRIQEDREAALSFLGCRNALQWTNEFIAGFLKDIVTKTEEVVFQPKPSPRLTLLLAFTERIPDFLDTEHEVVRVTLRSGEVFAVDLTGAQYGYHSPVTEWSCFLTQRIHHHTLHPLSTAPLMVLQANTPTVPTLNQLLANLEQQEHLHILKTPQIRILEQMNLHMIAWQLEGRLSTSGLERDHFRIRKMWRLPPVEFKRAMGNLVSYIEWKMAVWNGDEEVEPYSTRRGMRIARLVVRVGRGLWGFDRGEMEGFD